MSDSDIIIPVEGFQLLTVDHLDLAVDLVINNSNYKYTGSVENGSSDPILAFSLKNGALISSVDVWFKAVPYGFGFWVDPRDVEDSVKERGLSFFREKEDVARVAKFFEACCIGQEYTDWGSVEWAMLRCLLGIDPLLKALANFGLPGEVTSGSVVSLLFGRASVEGVGLGQLTVQLVSTKKVDDKIERIVIANWEYEACSFKIESLIFDGLGQSGSVMEGVPFSKREGVIPRFMCKVGCGKWNQHSCTKYPVCQCNCGANHHFTLCDWAICDCHSSGGYYGVFE